MYIATISSKNQITLPVKLLKRFGLKAGNKILFEEKQGNILGKPITTSVVDEVAGSLSQYVPASKRNIPFKKIREITQIEVAKYLAKKYNLPKPQK